MRVLRGKDRGKQGKIIKVFPEVQRVVVEGIQLVTKYTRPRRQGEKSQRISLASPVPIGNVQIVCPSCKKGTRVAISHQDGQRVRLCKKCQASLL